MRKSADILIVGGGIIGLTTAYFLAREGVRVSVVEKDQLGQEASWAGAGILPPGNRAKAQSPLQKLRAISSELFDDLSAELRAKTGVDNGYFRCGGLEFVDQPDENAEDEWRGEGIECRLVTGEDLRQMAPEVAPSLPSAYFLPHMAQLRNPRHLKAMIAACRFHAMELQTGCPALHWRRHGDRIDGLQTTNGYLTADKYLIAAGAWTDPLLRQFGCMPGIRPIRGQIALLRTEYPRLKHILLSGARYIVPRPDGRILAGSTEEDVGFNKRTTAKGVNDLLAMACRLAPALADAELERCWAGLRPGSPDGLPILGRVPGADNLYVAAGHFRAGIQLSPGTALVMTELLMNKELSMGLEAFSIDRFKNVDSERVHRQ